jgi:hypothetical protein
MQEKDKPFFSYTCWPNCPSKSRNSTNQAPMKRKIGTTELYCWKCHQSPQQWRRVKGLTRRTNLKTTGFEPAKQAVHRCRIWGNSITDLISLSTIKDIVKTFLRWYPILYIYSAFHSRYPTRAVTDWPCRNPYLFDVELATQSLSLLLTNQINRNLVA